VRSLCVVAGCWTVLLCSTAQADIIDRASALLAKLPFIPIPEIATDPNSGTSVGLLPVVLFPNAAGDVEHLLAPDLNYNDVLGVGGEFRLFNYPSANTEWYVVAGGSQNIAREVDLDYATGLTRQDLISFEGRFYFARDPSLRFFGLGNDSAFGNESNYTLEQVRGEGLLGVNATPQLQLALDVRPRRVRILRGAFTSVPFTGDQFPALEGLDGGTDGLARLIGSYDTRDSPQMPTKGAMVALFGGGADRHLASSVSYGTFGLDLRGYLPIAPRVTLAGHVRLQYVTASGELPFWTLSELGGEATDENSALGIPLGRGETWRGAGVGRYVDRNMFATMLELRIRVMEVAIAGARITLEPAPFVDLGRVFAHLGDNPVDVAELHPAGGIGFRALVPPFVVGYVDVGFGPRGAEFFSGINYPF
jgi:outer membrane protein assembly factor BamA